MFNHRRRQTTLPYLFTKEGYDALDFGPESPALNAYDANRWVLQDPMQTDAEIEEMSTQQKQELGKEIQTIYYQNYNNEWNGFVNGLNVKPSRSIPEQADALKDLADPIFSPIKAVLELTYDNTRLKPLPEMGSEMTALEASKLETTPVDRNFNELQSLMAAPEGQPAPVQDILGEY